MSNHRCLTIAVIAACPFPWPRGTPIRAFRIAEALSRLGHAVHVITYHLGEKIDCPFEVHRIEDVPGYRRTSAGPSITKTIRLNPALTRLSRAVHSRTAFDVVHAVHLEGLLVASNSMPGLPVIYDAHTSLSGELHSYIRYLPPCVVSMIGAYFDRTIPARADYTIAVSEKLRNLLVDCKAVKSSSIEVIPNGVEYETFQSHRTSIDHHRIIYTGNDASYQDLNLLLKAFLLLKKVNPLAKLALVGSSRFEREKAFVKLHRLEDSVEIHLTSFEEELGYLADASIAVSPRTLCDGIPQKILNYMAAGKAIVACEGSAAHLRNGVTGIRVTNDDPQALADALRLLIEDRHMARALAEAARREVLLEYSWESVARKIEAVYRKAIDRKKQAG